MASIKRIENFIFCNYHNFLKTKNLNINFSSINRRTLTTSTKNFRKLNFFPTASLITAITTGLTYYQYKKTLNTIHAKVVKPDNPEQQAQSQREQRFQNFASVEYQGHYFMTPRDFLESMTYDNPRYRTGRLKLSKAGIEKLLSKTPTKRNTSSQMFRNISEQGLISYTEYLFLLCVLTKPKCGFHIAFNMFDLDGDERVDKKEFLVLEQLLAHTEKAGVESAHDLQGHSKLNIWDLIKNSARDLDITGYYMEPLTETTLTVHFFGKNGKDVLNFEQFSKFMENLQTEVLELEFAEFSSGLKTITEIEFAQILLRYTNLTKEENDKFLNRLRIRIPEPKGIAFPEFKNFCLFLNNIDDFILAMRFYSYSGTPISQSDFARAVKACSGLNLDRHVVDVVFQLFDVDGDGKLSYKEFISVMKERLHRGSKHKTNTRWEIFKSCVKTELKNKS